MTQAVIINKLIQYAQWDNPHLASSRQDQQLLRTGLCHGFSLTYAVMNLLGYRDWWEKVLVAVYDWDGTPQNIDNKITINDHTYQLSHLLRRVFAYNVFYQPLPERYDAATEQKVLPLTAMIFPNMTQSSILDKDGQYLQAMDSANNKLTVQAAKTFAGNFQINDLLEILQPAFVKRRLCLVVNLVHCVCITYDESEGYWWLYDPNFPHCDQQHMKQFYATSFDLAHNLLKLMGTSLAFKIADMEGDLIESSWYENKLLTTPFSTLSDFAFALLLKESPYYVNMFFARMSATTLTCLFNTNDVLMEECGWNLLHYAVLSQPKFCSHIARHLKNERLERMLQAKGVNGLSPMDYMVKYSDTKNLQLLLDHLGPNSLNRLLEPRSSSIMFPMLHRIAYYHFPQGLAWTLNHMADWSWERFSAMLLTKDAEQKRVIDYNCDASLIKNFYYMLNNRTWRRLIDLDAEARLTNTVLYHLNHTELRSTLDLYSMLDIWSLKSCKHIRQLLKQEKKVNESSPSFASDIDFNSFDDFQCFDLIEESNSTELEKLFTVEYEQLSTSYSFFKRKPNHDEPSQDKSVHHVDEERPQKRMKQ